VKDNFSVKNDALLLELWIFNAGLILKVLFLSQHQKSFIDGRGRETDGGAVATRDTSLKFTLNVLTVTYISSTHGFFHFGINYTC